MAGKQQGGDSEQLTGDPWWSWLQCGHGEVGADKRRERRGMRRSTMSAPKRVAGNARGCCCEAAVSGDAVGVWGWRLESLWGAEQSKAHGEEAAGAMEMLTPRRPRP